VTHDVRWFWSVEAKPAGFIIKSLNRSEAYKI